MYPFPHFPDIAVDEIPLLFPEDQELLGPMEWASVLQTQQQSHVKVYHTRSYTARQG